MIVFKLIQTAVVSFIMRAFSELYLKKANNNNSYKCTGEKKMILQR